MSDCRFGVSPVNCPDPDELQFHTYFVKVIVGHIFETSIKCLYFYTDRSKAVLLLWCLTVLAVCVYTLVHLLC